MKKIIFTILISLLAVLGFSQPNPTKKPAYNQDNPGLLKFEDPFAKNVSEEVDRLLNEQKPQEATEFIFAAIKKDQENAELYLKAALLMLDLKFIDETYKLLENGSYVAKKKLIHDKINFYTYIITREFKTFDEGIALLNRINNTHSSEKISEYIQELEVLKVEEKKKAKEKEQNK